MTLLLKNHIGRVHHAAGNKHLQETRPTYCYIPEEFFGENGYEKSRYLVSRWPSINAGANPLAVGSHVLPDAARPANLRSRCPILREFLARLESIATVKTISAA